MMLFNRVGSELMGMCFKYNRIQSRCEVVFYDVFERVGNERMVMHFNSTGIQIRGEHVFCDAALPAPS